ncbi:MAG: MFS transporter [Pyrinomonadaceae bacterium]
MDATGSSHKQNEKPASEKVHVPRYSYYALAVLTLVNFLNYIDRQVLPAVAPFMFKDPKLNLTDTELGYMEAALLLSFTVLAPMFGRLGDRRSRTKLMASAAVIWSLATALTGLVDRLPFLPASVQLHAPIINVTLVMSGIALALCFVRAVVGVGESSYSTITPSLIADYFPPQKRATALGVFQAAIPMGFALGYVIGAVLASFFGWRTAFMIVGVPGLITAAIVWKLREPVRGATDEKIEAATALEEIAIAPAKTSEALAHTDVEESWIKTSLRILRTRDWILSTAGYTALTFVLGAFATWATVLLVRDKGMTETSAGITLGIVTLLGGATGTFGGGWLADRIAARRHNAYFLVCAVSSFLGIFPTLMALLSNNPYIYLPAIFFAVMLLFVNNAPFHAILINSVPALVRATAVALNIVIIHICGDVISRAGVGILSDSLKDGNFHALAALAQNLGIDPTRFHLTAALLVAPLALLISTFFFLWGSRKQHTA